jgi:Fur family transcriptional regulator, peroxide stress response regulator
MDIHNILTSSLSSAGLRLTPQRLAICKLLAASKEHPTAYAIYNQLHPDYPTISLATVYNTLDTLVNLGVVQELGSAGDDRVHYDADTAPHLNFACLACHRIYDLDSILVQELEKEVSSQSGFQVLGSRLLYYGYCPECTSGSSKPEN